MQNKCIVCYEDDKFRLLDPSDKENRTRERKTRYKYTVPGYQRTAYERVDSTDVKLVRDPRNSRKYALERAEQLMMSRG